MNIKPATSIKVSEMAKIKDINDDSVFLIVQNGVGHKISFKDLKREIIQNIYEEISQNSIDIKQLKNQQESDKKNIKDYVQEQLQEFQGNVVASARNGIERFKTSIQGNIDRYQLDVNHRIDKFKNDIDAKSLSNLEKKQENLETKIDNLEKTTTTQLEKSLSTSTQNIAELSIAFQQDIEKIIKQINFDGQLTINLSTDLQKDVSDIQGKLDILENTFNKNCHVLSSQLDDFDVKLYGLTIEDIDETTAKKITTHVKNGDIETLSAKIIELEQKINVLDEFLK